MADHGDNAAGEQTPLVIYQSGGRWGHHVTWLDTAKLRVYGHHPRRPQVGDLLRSEMRSGRVGIFRFVEVDLKQDPPDMFFGTVEAVGYEDELDMPSLFKPAPSDSPKGADTVERLIEARQRLAALVRAWDDWRWDAHTATVYPPTSVEEAVRRCREALAEPAPNDGGPSGGR